MPRKKKEALLGYDLTERHGYNPCPAERRIIAGFDLTIGAT
jgi:hypothetical protein